MSSEKHARTMFAVSLRFPTQGQSASGESSLSRGVKRVGDGQQVNNPVPPVRSEVGTHRGSPATRWSVVPSELGAEVGRQIRP
jgi:hypothetical protein